MLPRRTNKTLPTKTLAIGLLTIGLLTLAPSPAFAKPDSKADRTVQCANHRDPDGDSNGGVDKPGGQGSISADRDCNNGCGNDDDREDDNRGRCGHQKASRPADVEPEEVPGKVEITPAVGSAQMAPAVTLTATGTTSPVATAPTGAEPATETGTEVLGVTLERDDQADTSPASLPRTGAGIAGLTLAGATLIGTGRLLRRV